MKPSVRQAAKICVEALHQLGRIALLFFVLVLALLGLFAFTLSRHPIEVPRLASWLATQASGSGIAVHMEKAELAWQGYAQGARQPLVLRVSDIELRSAAGALLVTIPQGDLAVPPGDLFGGREAISLRAASARIAGSEAPVSLRAQLWPGPDFSLARGKFTVTIGAGKLGRPGAGIPVTAAHFTMETAPGRIDIADGLAQLAPVGQSAPLVHFSFTARRAPGWTARLHVTADAVRAQDIGAYWPHRVLHLTRAWVLKHITAGTARAADFSFAITAPGDLSEARLEDATGGFDASGVSLTWLEGFPPLDDLAGRFEMPGKDEAVITASSAHTGQVRVTSGRMVITGMVHKHEVGALTLQLAGPVPDVLALLDTRPLSLLRGTPSFLASSAGSVTGEISATIPFEPDLRFADIRLAVTADVRDLAIPAILPGLGLTQGALQVQSDGRALSLQGKAMFAGEPAQIALTQSLEPGGALGLSLQGAAGRQVWRWLGVNAATQVSGKVAGTAPFSLRLAGTPASQTAQLRLDLTPIALALPVFGWAKPAGDAGDLALTGRMENGRLAGIEKFAAHAPGLDVEGIGEGNGLTFTRAEIGRVRASGRLSWPNGRGSGWRADFSGPVLDIRQLSEKARGAKRAAAAASAPAAPPGGPGWTLRLGFTQLYLAPAPAPALGHLTLLATGRGQMLTQLEAAADGMDLGVTPRADGSHQVVFHAEDTGALLRALDLYGHLHGGTLTLGAQYGPGAPFAGRAELSEARFSAAPGITKVLEGMTLYGLAEAASGPGLKITRAEIPFTLADGVLHLNSLRAFASALGFTASGTVDLAGGNCDIDATVVPLYALNALPGKIPLLGRLFSPEKGGGLVAVRARLTGPIDHVRVSVNPLSALTPGFLRDIFGLAEK